MVVNDVKINVNESGEASDALLVHEPHHSHMTACQVQKHVLCQLFPCFRSAKGSGVPLILATMFT